MNSIHFDACVLFVGSALLAGCATAPPPKELVDARAAYERASIGPASRYTPAQLHVAKTTLERAERTYEAKGGNSDESKDTGYIAHRKALAAEATGRALALAEEKQQAMAELEALRGGALDQSAKDLDVARRQLEQEQKMRAEADQRTNQALAKLAGLQAKEDERGTVITLSGSVLFASGKSDLLPPSRSRLEEVANAIKDDDRSIKVFGHTDGQGNDEFNQALSQRRAESVRNFLIAHGVPSNRVDAIGKGKSEPISDNDSTEGRANNRRVEIVLRKADASR